MCCLQVSGSGDTGREEGLHSAICIYVSDRTELNSKTPCTQM